MPPNTLPHDSEVLLLYSRDFFGEAIPSGILSFYKGTTLVYKTKFVKGKIEIVIPEQLPPGVYTTVATRDDSTTGTYQVRDLVIPYSTHYFYHAQTHADVRLKDNNFDPSIQIPQYKIDPIFSARLFPLRDGSVSAGIDEAVLYSGHHDHMAWGGSVNIEGNTVFISRFQAVVKSVLYTFEDTKIDIPSNQIAYYLGIDDGMLGLYTTVPDLIISTISRDGPDWIRNDIAIPFHPIEDSDHNAIYFSDYLDQADRIEIEEPSTTSINGLFNNSNIIGKAIFTEKVSSFSCAVDGNTPVAKFEYGSFYIEAENSYFLVWEEDVLVAALPRFSDSMIEANWKEFLYITSRGNDGYVCWNTNVPLEESIVKFMEGITSSRSESLIYKTIAGLYTLANSSSTGWTMLTSSGHGSVNWSG